MRYVHSKMPALPLQTSVSLHRIVRTIPAALPKELGLVPRLAAPGGLLAGLGAFAISGIGPVVGAGWLATTLIGAAAGGLAGGLVGSLIEAEVEERDAHVYGESLRRGGVLVTARVDEEELDAAAAILSRDPDRSMSTNGGRSMSALAGRSLMRPIQGLTDVRMNLT